MFTRITWKKKRKNKKQTDVYKKHWGTSFTCTKHYQIHINLRTSLSFIIVAWAKEFPPVVLDSILLIQEQMVGFMSLRHKSLAARREDTLSTERLVLAGRIEFWQYFSAFLLLWVNREEIQCHAGPSNNLVPSCGYIHLASDKMCWRKLTDNIRIHCRLRDHQIPQSNLGLGYLPQIQELR